MAYRRNRSRGSASAAIAIILLAALMIRLAFDLFVLTCRLLVWVLQRLCWACETIAGRVRDSRLSRPATVTRVVEQPRKPAASPIGAGSLYQFHPNVPAAPGSARRRSENPRRVRAPAEPSDLASRAAAVGTDVETLGRLKKATRAGSLEEVLLWFERTRGTVPAAADVTNSGVRA